MATLYRKTPQGSTEIATRANQLSPRLRAALILVDGKRGDGELLKLIPGGAGEEALLTLLEAGYIEIVGAPAKATSEG